MYNVWALPGHHTLPNARQSWALSNDGKNSWHSSIQDGKVASFKIVFTFGISLKFFHSNSQKNQDEVFLSRKIGLGWKVISRPLCTRSLQAPPPLRHVRNSWSFATVWPDSSYAWLRSIDENHFRWVMRHVFCSSKNFLDYFSIPFIDQALRHPFFTKLPPLQRLHERSNESSSSPDSHSLSRWESKRFECWVLSVNVERKRSNRIVLVVTSERTQALSH